MKALSIKISELEYNKFRIVKERLAFTEFVEIISKELLRQSLIKSIEMSEKYGLSDMSMDEISAEVKAVRKNAKNRN